MNGIDSYNIGSRVICVKNVWSKCLRTGREYKYNLTIGKEYTIIESKEASPLLPRDWIYIKIIDDNSVVKEISVIFFKTIKEIRDKFIDEILFE